MRKDLIFYPETREILIACWRMHFEHETQAERLRQQNIPQSFDYYQCFLLLDTKNDGAIDSEEVRINKIIIVCRLKIC